jgi:sugar fermentation stimulation protein A
MTVKGIVVPLDLKVGELISRPNRFVFEGFFDGQRQRWHCPVTGKIGKIDNFQGVQCLFTPAIPSDKRSTQGTVEALYLSDEIGWIGINQNRINGWVETFLRKNALPNMINSEGCHIRHEVMAGGSRLDLLIEKGETRTFVELKTPIHDLLLTPNAHFTTPSSGISFFERLIRHYESLGQLAQTGHRTILAVCFMYDAPPFIPPPMDKWNEGIIAASIRAQARGVEIWQINLQIHPEFLEITRYERMNRQHLR